VDRSMVLGDHVTEHVVIMIVVFRRRSFKEIAEWDLGRARLLPE
jgi:hypothetical protein